MQLDHLNVLAAFLGAAHVQLDADDLRSINEALARLPLHGARYPAQLQSLVGR